MTARFRTLSQTPQAVRSAGGRRWEWVLPASAPADRTLQADKSDAFRLTVRVHGLRNISSTAANRAVVRSHSSPPSGLRALSTMRARNLPEIVLRYESRTSLNGIGSALRWKRRPEAPEADKHSSRIRPRGKL